MARSRTLVHTIDWEESKMIKSFPKQTAWLIVVTAFVIAGCQEGQRRKEAVYRHPLTDPNVVVPDYVFRAIEATGGQRAWTKVKKLNLDCVLTCYQQNDKRTPNTTKDDQKPAFYLTEQQYEIHPWQSSIRITADEPQGKVDCQSSPDKFSVFEGDPALYVLPAELRARSFAEIIQDITMAPAQLLDGSAVFTKALTPVKIEGRWYYPIERTNRAIGLNRPFPKTVFYQNTDTSLVDMLWFVDGDSNMSFTVRGYDYREVEKEGIRIPTRIKIFKTDTQAFSRECLVKIDYYSLKSTD